MELTILILLLPFFSFLILGIGGKWMSHRTAGTIGTLILGAVAVLSRSEERRVGKECRSRWSPYH